MGATGATGKVPASEISAVRRFNRFYTRRIGALKEGLLESPFSLTEMHVLYELAHRERPSAAELAGDLLLDPGYLSRILRRFESEGLLGKSASTEDGRRRILSLTAKGRRTFAVYDRKASGEVAGILEGLDAESRRRLLDAMAAIEGLLAGVPPPAAIVLRPPRAGDLGWIVHRHGALYAAEYGWGEPFEAVVARVIADYLASHDPQRERCWIAERGGEILGSVLLVRKSDRVAQLRLLLVEPGARGLGIGRRLVEACVDFARRRGYERVVLWTNARLDAARAIYEKTGFQLLRSQPSAIFGPSDIEQTWELAMTGGRNLSQGRASR
jgi:DNA-binding MarR family transcriptional regulator/ribosomal protein S18 acetylase RimI-like enzyme